MRSALVIGGSGGLGAALVRLLLDRGVSVAVAGRTRARDARVRPSRVLDPTRVNWRDLYRSLEQDGARPLDAVLFVAGDAVFGKTALVPDARARQVFDVNFWACTSAATAAADHWAGRAQAGTFAAVLSIVACRAVPFESHYAASKAAAARFLECLDLEYASRGIRFVGVCPGTLDTPFRARAEWFGLAPPAREKGADAARTAREIIEIVEGRRKARVIGWRERGIALADRLWPGLYDRAVLRARVRRRTG